MATDGPSGIHVVGDTLCCSIIFVAFFLLSLINNILKDRINQNKWIALHEGLRRLMLGNTVWGWT